MEFFHESQAECEVRKRLQAGLRLLGNYVRMNQTPRGMAPAARRVMGVNSAGMVRLEGNDSWFEPELFDIDGDVLAVPLMGTVS